METKNKKIIQISSGRGPEECCWVVAQVLKMIIAEAKSRGIHPLILHREQGAENGTLHSAVVRLEGSELNEFLKSWIGTIQWIGQSKFRKYHKRKNWFVGVKSMSVRSLSDFNEQDIKYEFTRSGGPGGQHVNKVSTAVRARHVPTGERVYVSQSRSQLQNKNEARRRLEQILKIKALVLSKQQAKEMWQNHDQLDRGNPVRTFRGSDFKPHHERKKYKSGRKRIKQEVFRRLDY